MFWGSSGKLETQRRPLREAFQVDDTSPLRDPDLRNDFEHFDERLESWFDESTRKIMLARNIGDMELTISGIDEKRFHFFNFATGIVTFWEHSVSVPDLVTEALRIQRILGPAA